MTGNTSTLSNRETFIQLLHGFAGLILDGLETSSEIKLSRNGHITVITITDSCARSSDMEATTEDSHADSPRKPNSLSGWSLDSSPSTSEPFQVTLSDSNGPTMSYQEWVTLRHLLAANDGSLDAEVILLPSERLTRMILKVHLPT